MLGIPWWAATRSARWSRDADPWARRGIRSRLAPSPELVVVGEAGDADELTAAVAELQPQVVVIDASLPAHGRGWRRPAACCRSGP